MFLLKSLLYAISIFDYGEEDTSPLSSGCCVLLKALLDASERSCACDNNLCVTAYEAMNVLIREAPADCQDHIISITNVFMDKLEHTFDLSVIA